MKLKFSRSLASKVHSASGFRIRASLRRVSENVATSQLASKAKPLKRELLPPSDPALNKSGDRRGINRRENPPSSDEMRKVRAMRKFYNKKMPVLACSNCAFAQQCPQYRAGYECAFTPFLNSHRIESVEDLVHYMKELLGATMRRAHLTMIMETLTGASPSLEVSEALGLAFQNLTKFHEVVTAQDSLSVEIDDPDGSLIGKLFGGLGNLVETVKEAKSKPIDVPSIVDRVQEKQKDLTEETNERKELMLAHAKESLLPALVVKSKAQQLAESLI